jgi:hypothetical protein
MLPFKWEAGELLDADCLLLSELHFPGTLRVCHMRLVECASGRCLGAGRVKLKSESRVDGQSRVNTFDSLL